MFYIKAFKKEQAGMYGIVHIAAHSDFQPQNPLFSAILLAADEQEDGRLETHEIFNLNLDQTDLVVLSACATHLGELSRGDELVGLERAFFRAGTPSLLSTLWRVDDKATAALMERFYIHLRAGRPKAESLCLAQIETRIEYPDPYYWAGFLLVGDAGISNQGPILHATSQENKDSWWLYEGSFVLLLMAVIFIRRYK